MNGTKSVVTTIFTFIMRPRLLPARPWRILWIISPFFIRPLGTHYAHTHNFPYWFGYSGTCYCIRALQMSSMSFTIDRPSYRGHPSTHTHTLYIDLSSQMPRSSAFSDPAANSQSTMKLLFVFGYHEYSVHCYSIPSYFSSAVSSTLFFNKWISQLSQLLNI